MSNQKISFADIGRALSNAHGPMFGVANPFSNDSHVIPIRPPQPAKVEAKPGLEAPPAKTPAEIEIENQKANEKAVREKRAADARARAEKEASILQAAETLREAEKEKKRQRKLEKQQAKDRRRYVA